MNSASDVAAPRAGAVIAARRRSLWLAGATVLSALAAASAAHADEASCKALGGQAYPASAMSLPTTGAKINSADWVEAKANFGAYCKLLGQIDPVDPTATPILFEINLPAAWNKKVMQEGGGGLNGVLVSGAGLLRDAPPGSQPLAHGYATLGTDGGHPNAKPEIGIFFKNDEEVINNAYGANKKSHDLALGLITAYYKERPAKVYFFGGSEGGREAMVGVEKYPQDYDGIVAVVPILNDVGTYLAKYNAYEATVNGGWMNKAKIKLLQDDTARQCDMLDGLKDGVISKYEGCGAIYKYDQIRCPDGKDDGDTCLSDPQIAAVKTWRSPYSWGFPLKDGATSIPGWSIGGEGNAGSVNPWIMLDTAPTPQTPGGEITATQWVRYYLAKDDNYRGPIDLTKYRARILQTSQNMDEANPDLSAFLKRGGKLIMKENTADYAVSPYGVFNFYKGVVAKMGQATVNGFVRIYVNPGVNHGGSGLQADGSAVPDKVDLLAALDNWVETGTAPGPMTVTSFTRDGAPVASKPLCRYPEYPRYKAGDAKQAASFTCEPL